MSITSRSHLPRLKDDPATPRTDATVPFREIVPPADHPKIAGIDKHDAISWCADRRKYPQANSLISWLELKNLDKPYVGFTTDGKVREGVYTYEDDEGAPTEAIVAAARALLGILTSEQHLATCFESIDVDEMRIWSNPEIYVNPGGLRMDQCSPEIQQSVHALLQASTSEQGYAKILGCTLLDGFLGQLVNGRAVLNEHSFNFRLFGTPSLTEPWGFSFFGHHLAINLVVHGKRMVIGPTFQGAEPDRIDVGPHAGLRLFSVEEIEALTLMRGLPPELQKKAQLSEGMGEQDLPADRWNPFDERHLGGARQDNRVVPFEGCPVSEMNSQHQEAVLRIFAAFNLYYPSGPFEHRLRQIKAYLHETHFAWIGGFELGDPYYFRLHSPVAYSEFDFHAGIFLTNTSPAKCHIHTINRLPNAGDYGKALVFSTQSNKVSTKNI